MKKLAVVICSLMILAGVAMAQADTLYPARANGLWGYMNYAGEIVIAPQYTAAEGFRGDVALVKTTQEEYGGYGLIDRRGDYVLKPEWYYIEAADDLEDGFYEIETEDNLRGYYDLKYNYFYAPNQDVHPIPYGASGELIPAYVDGQTAGYLWRTTGAWAIAPQYDLLDWTWFYDHYACGTLVQNEDEIQVDDKGEPIVKCHIIWDTGEVIELPDNIVITGYFSNGLAAYQDNALETEEPWLLGIMDYKGNVIVEPQYKWIGDLNEGYICVCKDDLWGHLDREGNVIVEPKFTGDFGQGNQTGYTFNNGLAIFDDDANSYMRMEDGTTVSDGKGRWLAIDYKGNIVFSMPSDGYELYDLMDNGLLWYKKYVDDGEQDYWYTIDPVSRRQITYTAEGREAKHLPEGYQWHLVSVPKMYYGLLDRNGNVVSEAQWQINHDDPSEFSEGLFPVAKDGKSGFIDEQGNIAIPLLYDDAFSFSNGLAQVELDGNLGYIDHVGNIVYMEGISHADME